MLKEKCILITGGAGAIGSGLANRLVQLNKVIVLDDLSSGFRSNLSKEVVFFNGSVLDDRILSEVFRNKPEIVFHMACLFANQNSVDHPFKDLEVNGIGTLKVLQHAQKNRVERLVFASSSCVYGNSNGPLSETGLDFKPDTPYAITKLLGERYVTFFSKFYGLPTIILRYFNSYGPGEYPGKYRNVIPNFFAKALKAKPLPITGIGKETRDFNYVSDTVDATIRASYASKAIGEIFNVGSGKETKIIDLANKINEITGNKAGLEFREKRKWDLVLKRLANIEAAKSVLGYVPKVSLVDGLLMTYKWFLENKVI